MVKYVLLQQEYGRNPEEVEQERQVIKNQLEAYFEDATEEVEPVDKDVEERVLSSNPKFGKLMLMLESLEAADALILGPNHMGSRLCRIAKAIADEHGVHVVIIAPPEGGQR